MSWSYNVENPVDEDVLNALRKALDELYEFNGYGDIHLEKLNLALSFQPPRINRKNIRGISLEYGSDEGRYSLFIDSKEEVMRIGGGDLGVEHDVPFDRDIWNSFVEKIDASGVLRMHSGKQKSDKTMEGNPEWKVRAWSMLFDVSWNGSHSIPEEVVRFLPFVKVFCDDIN